MGMEGGKADRLVMPSSRIAKTLLLVGPVAILAGVAVAVVHGSQEDQAREATLTSVRDCLAGKASEAGLSPYDFLKTHGLPAECFNGDAKMSEEAEIRAIEDDPSIISCIADEFERFLVRALPEASLRMANPNVDLTKKDGPLGEESVYGHEMCFPWDLSEEAKDRMARNRGAAVIAELEKRGWSFVPIREEMARFSKLAEDNLINPDLWTLNPQSPLSPLSPLGGPLGD
jgi:hypothetical protein